MSDAVQRSKNTLTILAITPLIVAAFVLGGLFLGLYLSDIFGIPRFILALVLSTGGLFASLPVVVKFVDWMIRKETTEKNSDDHR
jgi:Zn-dependent protease with chaperone function